VPVDQPRLTARRIGTPPLSRPHFESGSGCGPWAGRGKIRAMQPLRLVIWVLLATMAGLAPLAYASPPDPLWIPGIYDDDDQDDVIVAVTNADGSVDRPSVGPIAPTCIDRRLALDRDASRPHFVVAYSFHGPAPPLLPILPLI
jgi:hypothetical protein